MNVKVGRITTKNVNDELLLSYCCTLSSKFLMVNIGLFDLTRTLKNSMISQKNCQKSHWLTSQMDANEFMSYF